MRKACRTRAGARATLAPVPAVIHIDGMKESGKSDPHVQAAGGIVLRESARPLVAIVRLRKDNSWVLPKGKLKPSESLIAAAKREVEEETGHEVTVLGFLGALSQVTDGRHKIVHFWHMRASATPARALTHDVKAVKWLPLSQAVDMLTRSHERVFLSHVGPLAIKAAEESRRVRSIGRAGTIVSESGRGSERNGKARRSAALRGVIGAWLKKRLQRFERRGRSREVAR